MPGWRQIVVVEEMNEAALGERPTQVSHDARNAPGRIWISHISHAIACGFGDLAGAAFGTVVNDNHLDRRALLAQELFSASDSAFGCRKLGIITEKSTGKDRSSV